MPFDTVQRPDHDLVITIPFGANTDEDLLAYYTKRLEEGTLGGGRHEVVDGRWIDSFDVTPSGQAELVSLLTDQEDLLQGMRWAFIADSMVAFGMFRMFEGQKADLPIETSVFRTTGAAAEWLKVPRDALHIDPPV